MQTYLESPNSNYLRYERKFIVSELSRHEIELLVALHPAMFRESYPPRRVNNLYFDSFSMANYFDNINGLKDRAKVRIRWYGDIFGVVEGSVLQLKVKSGAISSKEAFPMPPFAVDEHLQRETVMELFDKSEIPDTLKLELSSLDFSLLNSYQRKYFESADKKFRITTDSEMIFYERREHSKAFFQTQADLFNTVVELKYSPEEDQFAERISTYFPFRVTRTSKYVNGIERMHLRSM
jgi:hypothetical protein